MGHTDMRTTEIYLHVLDDLGDKIKSPQDPQILRKKILI